MAKGLSISRLALQAGIGKATLSYWESGSRSPSIAELDLVLGVLELTETQRAEAIRMVDAPRAVKRLREVTEGAPPIGGDLLRALRLRRRWTQEQLATEMNVRQGTIAKWERGDTWPPIESLHTMCFLLDATLEELEVLTSGRMGLRSTSRDTSFDAFVFRAWQVMFLRVAEIRDLEYLSLQADLWVESKRSAWAGNLLAMVFARHSQYLVERERYSEARFSADNALSLGRNLPEGPGELIDRDELIPAVVSKAKALLHSSDGRLHYAIDLVHGWLGTARSPEYKAWLLSELGSFMAKRGSRTEALLLMESATQEAAKCRNYSELVCRRIDHATTLLEFGEIDDASDLLQRFESPPNQLTFEEAFLRARVAHSLKDEVLTATWMQRMQDLSRNSGNERHQRLLNAFEAFIL